MTYNTEPPVVSKLTLSYTYITDPETLDHCLEPQRVSIRRPHRGCTLAGSEFRSLLAVSDQQPALHFGFDQRLPAGLVSLYVQVPGAEELAPGTSSAFTWEYLSRSGWLQLGVRDETNGLRQSGMVQFIGPPDAVAAPGAWRECLSNSRTAQGRGRACGTASRWPVVEQRLGQSPRADRAGDARHGGWHAPAGLALRA